MRQLLSILLSCMLMTTAMAGERLAKEEPIVSPAQLRERLRASAETRERQLHQVERLFKHEAVQRALQSAKLDAGQVTAAAALMSSDELARLAARSAEIERDIAAGAFSNLMLTYIVIALVSAVIVLVLVS
jgi:hypothetical protein